MGMWEILEIDPTADISIIKKAYAKKIKSNHPEDNPHGFQKLREAYDDALKYAKSLTQFQETFTSDSFSDEINTIKDNRQLFSSKLRDNIEVLYPEDTDICNIDEIIIDSTATLDLINEFIHKMDKLYTNFFERIEIKNWEKLLNTEIIWRFDTKEYMSRKILYYLKSHYYLPHNVWILMNDFYKWDEQISYLNTFYPPFFIKYLLLQLEEDILPRYCNFEKDEEIDYDLYLSFREQAIIALIDNNLAKAEELISQAFEVYTKDPDLYCIKGEYYYKNGQSEKAKSEFIKAADIKVNDRFYMNYKAKVLFDLGLYEDAFKVCNTIVSRNKDVTEVRILAGKCLLEMEDWKDASSIFIANINRNPLDMQSKRYLKMLLRKFKEELKVNPFKINTRHIIKRIYHILGEDYALNDIKITSDIIKVFLKRLIINVFIVIQTLLYIVLIIISFGIITDIFPYKPFGARSDEYDED